VPRDVWNKKKRKERESWPSRTRNQKSLVSTLNAFLRIFAVQTKYQESLFFAFISCEKFVWFASSDNWHFERKKIRIFLNCHSLSNEINEGSSLDKCRLILKSLTAIISCKIIFVKNKWFWTDFISCQK